MLDGGGDICPGIFCLGDKYHLSTNTVCFNVSTDTTTNLKEIFWPKMLTKNGEKNLSVKEKYQTETKLGWSLQI